jgi:hypothetical protein
MFSCKTNIKDRVMNIVQNNNDDLERLQLLDIVFTRGVNALSREELERLHDLIEKKDYSHDKKAQKSKAKLLKKIGNAIYDHDVRYGSSFKMS